MDSVHRFLFEDLDIRGALVQLGPSWAAMNSRRHYAPPVRDMLGQLAAITALIGSNLKVPGRISFQLQGHGAVTLLVMDCDEQLHLRGMAKSALTADAETHITSVGDLLGDGRLVLTLHSKTAQTPYQSVVPITGKTLADIFEHYLTQSEQQPARMWLAATADTACGLFLQKLPDADLRDADGWNRIETLAATVSPVELALPPETVLSRLFGTETLRLFPPREATWHCPRDEEKVRNMLLSMGREEVEAILADAEMIAIEDEICGHEYRFGPEIVDELFPPDGRLLH